MIFWILGVLGVALLAASLVLDDLISGLDFGPEWLSGTAVGAGLAAFGLVGGLAASTGASTLVAGGAGVAGGLSLGLIGGWLTKSLSRGEGGAVFSPENYIGATGTVVTSIGGGAIGEVSIPVKGHPVKLNARADTALPAGTPIEVTQAFSATLVHVRPSSAPAA